MGVLTITEAGYIGAILCPGLPGDELHRVHVLSEVATDGRDLKIAELAGLYRRSPLLTMSLILGIFALSGAAFHRVHRQAALFYFGHELRAISGWSHRGG